GAADRRGLVPDVAAGVVSRGRVVADAGGRRAIPRAWARAGSRTDYRLRETVRHAPAPDDRGPAPRRSRRSRRRVRDDARRRRDRPLAPHVRRAEFPPIPRPPPGGSARRGRLRAVDGERATGGRSATPGGGGRPTV